MGYSLLCAFEFQAAGETALVSPTFQLGYRLRKFRRISAFEQAAHSNAPQRSNANELRFTPKPHCSNNLLVSLVLVPGGTRNPRPALQPTNCANVGASTFSSLAFDKFQC
jgi:hypothetical protein